MRAPDRLEALAALIERALVDADAIVAQAAEGAARLAQSPADALVAYGVGALLHAFYTELEKLFQRLARELDGFEPRGEAWHTDLLDEMSLDLPAVRPPVLGEALKRRLHEYLRFRHLFRNLYVLDLDGDRMARLLDALPAVWSDTRSALLAFADALRAIGGGLRG